MASMDEILAMKKEGLFLTMQKLMDEYTIVNVFKVHNVVSELIAELINEVNKGLKD